MTTSRYLFVVKNPKSESFSRSDDGERRLIHRHAQIDTIRRQRSTSTAESSQDSDTLAFIYVKPKLKPARRSSKQAQIKQISSSSSFVSCRCSALSRGPCPIHTIYHVPTSKEHVIDPFASTVAPLDQQGHSLLQYFIHVSHPRTWHSEVQRDRSYTFKADASTLVRGCFENEVHFYPLLASMASQMQHFDHLHQDGDQTNVLVTKAIAAVSSYLRTTPPVDQRLVFDIHQLAVTEFYRYELESAHVHLRAVKALLPHVGGIEKIDTSLREWIVIGDGYLAAELLSKPLFPASCFDPGGFPLGESTTIDAQFSIGHFLHEEKYRMILPPQMRTILLDMTEAVRVLQGRLRLDTSTSASGASMSTLHWLHLRTTALRHRLLDLDIDDVKLDAFRIGLLLWLFLVMTVTGRQRTCKRLSSILKSRLHKVANLTSTYWVEYEDILLWLLLLGAMSSDVVDREWFLAAVWRLGPVVMEEKELAQSSMRFFYLDTVQKPWLQAAVADLTKTPQMPTIEVPPTA